MIKESLSNSSDSDVAISSIVYGAVPSCGGLAGRWVTASCLPSEKLDRLIQELKIVKGVAADYATFSGMGELGLASNLGEGQYSRKS